MPRSSKVAILLFFSGACALMYQTVWLREFRLIFGASTPASAAVLAIFMGGLGLGGALLGRRVDAHPRPLALYANLELVVAISSALTPLLLWGARAAYIALGGAVHLGDVVGTGARLVLTVLVLGVPTLAMGGTLPAAARAVQRDDDAGRQTLALLYGVNALGAVAGTLLATFAMLEMFGIQTSLVLAALVNALVALVARSLARQEDDAPVDPPVAVEPGPAPRPTFVLVAAFSTGFVFLLMELVWYRMLGPLLGGSTYTFGLILAVALAGIAIGGTAYALRPRSRAPRPVDFALTCAVEALLLGVPLVLGDKLALGALLVRPFGAFGFAGLVGSWAAVCVIVVLPAAIVSGYQFPLLIALLGQGKKDVGQQAGAAYAWNTLGSILGSLAGGFGALPLLTAPGTWRLVIGLLVALAAAAIVRQVVTAAGGTRAPGWAAVAAGVGVLAIGTLFARGPTAAWRHTPIGAGLATEVPTDRNSIEEWMRARRHRIAWELDGRESSVALNTTDGFSFIVNGKPDGNAIGDSPTQVMAGLVGGILHPHPVRSLVIGLGTGSTAGWLADVPSMERVDAVEIEPAIREVARVCAPVNRDVLNHPKVQLLVADAREVLLTTRERYDIIFSEPSNPYRAGIASLYTKEFYEAARERLSKGGLFLQWLQAYAIDSLSVRTAMATLKSAFPAIEVYQTGAGDLLFVAGEAPLVLDAAQLRARIAEEPFRTALAATWRVVDLEGFLAHFVAGGRLVDEVARQEGDEVNTDDMPLLEFAFARNLGQNALFSPPELRQAAARMGAARPEVRGEVDWASMERQRLLVWLAVDGVAPPAAEVTAASVATERVYAPFAQGDDRGAQAALERQPISPTDSYGWAVVGWLLGRAGNDEANAWADKLAAYEPGEAELVRARLAFGKGQLAEATDGLARGFARARQSPWITRALLSRALRLTLKIAAKDAALGRRLFQELAEPFSVGSLDELRETIRVELARQVDFPGLCAEALAPWGEEIPWTLASLRARRDCHPVGAPPTERSQRELAIFTAELPTPFLTLTQEAPAPVEPTAGMGD